MTYGELNLLQAIVSVGILRDLENVISSATMPGILVVATEQLAVASGVAIFRESAQTRERHQHRGREPLSQYSHSSPPLWREEHGGLGTGLPRVRPHNLRSPLVKRNISNVYFIALGVRAPKARHTAMLKEAEI